MISEPNPPRERKSDSNRRFRSIAFGPVHKIYCHLKSLVRSIANTSWNQSTNSSPNDISITGHVASIEAVPRIRCLRSWVLLQAKFKFSISWSSLWLHIHCGTAVTSLVASLSLQHCADPCGPCGPCGQNVAAMKKKMRWFAEIKTCCKTGWICKLPARFLWYSDGDLNDTVLSFTTVLSTLCYRWFERHCYRSVDDQ
jgi:hypothetical protein